MLRMITWGQFLTYLGWAALVAYPVMGALIYRKGWRPFRNRGAGRGKHRSTENGDTVGNDLTAAVGKAVGSVTRPGQGGEVVGQGSQDKALSDFKLTEKVIGQLKSLVAKVVADGAVREDQLRAVRHYLQRYYHLKGTGYAVAINNALSREFQQLGAGELDAKDIEAIWAGEKSGNT